jgi:pimeloyl-ACP methyl ester carboxylesterase
VEARPPQAGTSHLKPMNKPGVVVFVHGIFGGAGTWSALTPLLAKDAYIERFFDLELFTYDSPAVIFNPLKRIPDFADVANQLVTALGGQPRFSGRSCIVLVGHSQGGLIIQRMLVDAVRNDRADEDLARIRGVVLLATPNGGSELFLSARRAIDRLWAHPQEKTLRPFNEEIADIHSALLKRVVYAQRATAGSRPIRFDVYTGASDGVVPAHSARGMFPHTGTLPGDHSSIVRPTPEQTDVVGVLSQACRRAFGAVEPDATVYRTEVLDPLVIADVRAAEALFGENFGANATVTPDDFRHWLANYEETFGLTMRVMVARVNERIQGVLMFHESIPESLIVIDYVACRTEPGAPHLLLTKLVEQLRLRATSAGIGAVVFEIEDPSTRSGHDADRARARLRRFQALGGRVIGGLSYLAPDMQDFGEAQESYLLMHVSSSLPPNTLSRERVRKIVRFLYKTWYSNWFSRRFAGREEELRTYIEGLYERVAGDAAKLPDSLPLEVRHS